MEKIGHLITQSHANAYIERSVIEYSQACNSLAEGAQISQMIPNTDDDPDSPND